MIYIYVKNPLVSSVTKCRFVLRFHITFIHLYKKSSLLFFYYYHYNVCVFAYDLFLSLSHSHIRIYSCISAMKRAFPSGPDDTSICFIIQGDVFLSLWKPQPEQDWFWVEHQMNKDLSYDWCDKPALVSNLQQQFRLLSYCSFIWIAKNGWSELENDWISKLIYIWKKNFGLQSLNRSLEK